MIRLHFFIDLPFTGLIGQYDKLRWFEFYLNEMTASIFVF